MYAECPPCPTLRAAFAVPVPTRRGNSKHIGVDARLIKQKRSWAGRRLVTGWTQQRTRARLDLALANKYSGRGRKHAELQPVLLVPTEAKGTLDNACSLTPIKEACVLRGCLAVAPTARWLGVGASCLLCMYFVCTYVVLRLSRAMRPDPQLAQSPDPCCK